jgi:hypothetical protein
MNDLVVVALDDGCTVRWEISKDLTNDGQMTGTEGDGATNWGGQRA